MSQPTNDQNQDSGFRQIIDQVAAKRTQSSQAAKPTGGKEFKSVQQAFRYLGQQLSKI